MRQHFAACTCKRLGRQLSYPWQPWCGGGFVHLQLESAGESDDSVCIGGRVAGRVGASLCGGRLRVAALSPLVQLSPSLRRDVPVLVGPGCEGRSESGVQGIE
jgi:hypothetical protein